MISVIKKNFNDYTFEIYLFCLIPYFLVFSIFLADFSLVILSCLFIFRIFKNEKIDQLKNFLFYLFIFFWVYNIIISFFSIDQYLSFKSSIFYLRFLLLPFLIYNLIIENETFLKKFLVSVLALLIILAFDGFVEYFTGSNIFNYEKHEIGRVASLFKDEYIYGTFFLKFFFPVSAIIYHLADDNKKNIFFIVFYFISLFCIFISGDRTPLFLFLISSALVFFLIDVKFLNKLIFSLLAVIFFLTLLFSNENIFNRLVNKTLVEFGSEKGLNEENQRLTKFTYKGKEITFMPQHQTYMIISINMFKEKPLFGHGPRAFKKLSCNNKYKLNQFSCSSHPHNYYFQLLAENGIIGFLLLSAALIYTSIILLREIFSSKSNLKFESRLLIIGIFINLFPLTQTGNFFGNWNSILLYLPLGFYFGILQRSKKEKINLSTV